MLKLEEFEFISASIKSIEEVMVDVIKSKPYGVVHDSHEIIMCGKKAKVKMVKNHQTIGVVVFLDQLGLMMKTEKNGIFICSQKSNLI